MAEALRAVVTGEVVVVIGVVLSGPGPLVGPTLAAQFGYLPGTLWLIVGAVLFLLVGREDALLASVLPQIAESGGTFLATLPDVQRQAIASHLDSAFRIVFVVLAVFAIVSTSARYVVESPPAGPATTTASTYGATPSA